MSVAYCKYLTFNVYVRIFIVPYSTLCANGRVTQAYQPFDIFSNVKVRIHLKIRYSSITPKLTFRATETSLHVTYCGVKVNAILA